MDSSFFSETFPEAPKPADLGKEAVGPDPSEDGLDCAVHPWARTHDTKLRERELAHDGVPSS